MRSYVLVRAGKCVFFLVFFVRSFACEDSMLLALGDDYDNDDDKHHHRSAVRLFMNDIRVWHAYGCLFVCISPVVNETLIHAHGHAYIHMNIYQLIATNLLYEIVLNEVKWMRSMHNMNLKFN